MVTVSEGGSVNISCTSIGSPVPTISWTLNNQMTRFTKTDLSTEPSVAVTTLLNFAVTDGVVESTLQIVNTQYPADDGVYVCTGSNTHDGVTTSTSAMITVQVSGMSFVLCSQGCIKMCNISIRLPAILLILTSCSGG